MNSSVISIHSVPRSGSSWLLSIFNSIANTKCVYQPLFSYAFKNVLSPASTKSEYDSFIDNISKTDDDFCTMRSKLHTNNGTIEPPNFNKTGIDYVVMKHTTHHHLIEQLLRFDENIKIIGLIRSPEDVISSQMKASHERLIDWHNGMDKNKDDIANNYFGFNKWNEATGYFIKLKKKYPTNVYLLNYEDLVQNPLNEIRGLFAFCNLELTESTQTFIQLSTNTTSEYDYSVYRSKLQSMNKCSALSPEILQFIRDNTIL